MKIMRHTLAIYLAGALLTGPAAAEQPYRWLIPHPGKHELIYYPDYSKEKPGHERATVAGREIIVPMGVVPPSAQSLYLLSHWEIRDGETVLDIGTGSGVQALFAADHAAHIVATDIGAKAVAAARDNIVRHGLAKKVEVRKGDLFGPIDEDERFDVILFNIDYPYDEQSQPLWKVHERFFAGVEQHLEPGGRIYYQAGQIDNIPHIQAMAEQNGLRITSMRMDAALEVERDPIVFTLYRKADLQLLQKEQAQREYQGEE